MASDIADLAPASIRLPVNPAKLMRMTWPFYALVAVSIALQPQRWMQGGPAVAAALLLPLLLPLLGALARGRWALELTPEALVHVTLRGPETFAWSRMGPPELRAVTILHLPLARVLWLRFPIDEPRTLRERALALIGRRILLVFGDRSAKETLELVDSWRKMALAAPVRWEAEPPR